MGLSPRIDLIHDTHHLCTRFRIDRIKAMSRGFSGGQTSDKICKCRECPDPFRSTTYNPGQNVWDALRFR